MTDTLRSLLTFETRPKVHAPFGFVPAFYLLLAYLAGVTIIGKGPTYLGYPPFFWGELVMVVSLAFLVHGKPDHLWSSPKYDWLAFTVLAWMFVGLFRTAFSFPQWGLDSIRDAALWYYASFFFVGLGLSVREYWASRTFQVLKVFWILALFWGTANWLSKNQLSESGPYLPWRGVTLFFNARDEIAQNAALGALVVLGCSHKARAFSALRPLLVPLSLVGLALFASSEGRAVKIAFAVSTAVLLSLLSAAHRPIALSRRWGKFLLLLVPLVLVAFLAVPGLGEKMQLDRFGDNAQAQGTKEWRAIWWNHLFTAVLTTNPAFGLGFGESLHVYNPMIADRGEEWEVRSPHNFNITVFTRMGFVGLALLAAIVIGGAGQLYWRIWRGSTAGRFYTDGQREELTFWLFVLVCTYINSSMGVLMEGPALGIPFWFVLGFSHGRAAGILPNPAGRLVPHVRDLVTELRAGFALEPALLGGRNQS